MESKALEKLLAEAQGTPHWEALIRRAYALGRKERGKRVAVGYVVPDLLMGARLSPRPNGPGSFKVEVLRCK